MVDIIERIFISNQPEDALKRVSFVVNSLVCAAVISFVTNRRS